MLIRGNFNGNICLKWYQNYRICIIMYSMSFISVFTRHNYICIYINYKYIYLSCENRDKGHSAASHINKKNICIKKKSKILCFALCDISFRDRALIYKSTYTRRQLVVPEAEKCQPISPSTWARVWGGRRALRSWARLADPLGQSPHRGPLRQRTTRGGS